VRNRCLLRLVEFSVVLQFITKTAESVGVSECDSAAEVEDGIADLVDVLNFGVNEFTQRVKDWLKPRPIGF